MWITPLPIAATARIQRRIPNPNYIHIYIIYMCTQEIRFLLGCCYNSIRRWVVKLLLWKYCFICVFVCATCIFSVLYYKCAMASVVCLWKWSNTYGHSWCCCRCCGCDKHVYMAILLVASGIFIIQFWTIVKKILTSPRAEVKETKRLWNMLAKMTAAKFFHRCISMVHHSA